MIEKRRAYAETLQKPINPWLNLQAQHKFYCDMKLFDEYKR